MLHTNIYKYAKTANKFNCMQHTVATQPTADAAKCKQIRAQSSQFDQRGSHTKLLRRS